MSREPLRQCAPAKVNLTLRVQGRRSDGFHDLESLVTFAALADVLTLTPGERVRLEVAGPTAAFAGDISDNLILRAHRELEQRVPSLKAGLFRLRKILPVAAGLGGGSSDAAAALRLLAELNDLSLDDARLLAAAQAVGSDVPVCLAAVPRMMRGRGELLGEPVDLPSLFAVLVNPRVAVPTPAVFRGLDLAPGQTLAGADSLTLPGKPDRTALLAYLASSSNDLEPPAIALAPVIDAARQALQSTQGVDLVRMSGSGATVFALYPDGAGALSAAKHLAQDHPDWWVEATTLG
jgi:4-diphosphocytidyl-2-C-methyl-D-erythritol kinase